MNNQIKNKENQVDLEKLKYFYKYMQISSTDIPAKDNVLAFFKKMGSSTSFARKMHKEIKSWEIEKNKN